MKKSLSCAVAVLLTVVATSLAGPEKAAIMANEKAAWQAYKDKKADDFKKVVDKDIKCVYADGVSDMAKDLSDMKKWESNRLSLAISPCSPMKKTSRSPLTP
jgi:hypothetical protein